MTSASKKPTANSKPTAKPRGKPWPKGVSGNPRGAPKRGESWAEIYTRIGNMTPSDAADYCKSIAGQLKTLGSGITLKEAVALRVFTALLFEPQAGLLNSVMERVEGKVADKVELYDWREDARAVGLDPDTLAWGCYAVTAVALLTARAASRENQINYLSVTVW